MGAYSLFVSHCSVNMWQKTFQREEREGRTRGVVRETIQDERERERETEREEEIYCINE